MKGDKSAYGPGNPHPLSKIKTELVSGGKYDEYGNSTEILSEIPHDKEMTKSE